MTTCSCGEDLGDYWTKRLGKCWECMPEGAVEAAKEDDPDRYRDTAADDGGVALYDRMREGAA